jgi:chemotaxis protein CheD
MTDDKITDVPMSEIRVSTNDNILRSTGIGSCIVIILHDPVTSIGAMAHPVLSAPTEQIKDERSNIKEDIENLKSVARKSEDTSSLRSENLNLKSSFRFIRPAIDAMIEEITKAGAQKNQLEASLVGGAHMFKVFDKNHDTIGRRNIEVARKKLEEEGIKIKMNDTGGNVGRSVIFDTSTGSVEVNTKI